MHIDGFASVRQHPRSKSIFAASHGIDECVDDFTEIPNKTLKIVVKQFLNSVEQSTGSGSPLVNLPEKTKKFPMTPKQANTTEKKLTPSVIAAIHKKSFCVAGIELNSHGNSLFFLTNFQKVCKSNSISKSPIRVRHGDE